MKGRKGYVLVGDDEEVMRSLFTDLLSELGYEVITAKNGQEAVEEIGQKDFAIAFIDVHMPVMNGVDALRAIKKIKPRIPIVMMDSFPDRLIKEAKEQGAITCIHKPFEIKQIKEIMARISGD